MKKLILVLLVVCSANLALAQESTKNSYIEKSNKIEATLYHDNGVIAQQGWYTKDNKLDGEWISYDDKGNKTAVATYNKGKKVGTWMFYQGDTIKEVVYTNSDIAEVKTWSITDTRVVTNKP